MYEFTNLYPQNKLPFFILLGNSKRPLKGSVFVESQYYDI